MILEYDKLNELNRYKIMSDSIIPRPIAWIVTEDNGIVNVAPFSYFIPISTTPALVVVSIGEKEDGTPKDSLFNILKNKKATICFVNKSNIDDVKKTSLSLAKNESESKKFNIETKRLLEEYPEVISSSSSALFCEFFDKIDIPSKTTPVILKVNYQYLEDGRLDEKSHVHLDNIARCGVEFKELIDIKNN